MPGWPRPYRGEGQRPGRAETGELQLHHQAAAWPWSPLLLWGGKKELWGVLGLRGLWRAAWGASQPQEAVGQAGGAGGIGAAPDAGPLLTLPRSPWRCSRSSPSSPGTGAGCPAARTGPASSTSSRASSWPSGTSAWCGAPGGRDTTPTGLSESLLGTASPGGHHVPPRGTGKDPAGPGGAAPLPPPSWPPRCGDARFSAATFLPGCLWLCCLPAVLDSNLPF